MGEESGKNLPEDIVFDILSRLPVESLIRFRCVSKRWNALIKDSKFIAAHLNNNSCKNDSILIIHIPWRQDKYVFSVIPSLTDDPTTTVDIDLPFLKDLNYLDVVGPCNGLVCLLGKTKILLSNPATREHRELPPPPHYFDPKSFIHGCGIGFGFDPTTGDYKVVRISHPFVVEIYNLSTDSWREKTNCPVGPAFSDFKYHAPSQLLFNGAFHWYAMDCGYGGQQAEAESILAFNMTTEVFQAFAVPEAARPVEYPDRCLSVLNDSLAFIVYDSELQHGGFRFDIWLMNEYGVKESWTRQCTLEPFDAFDDRIFADGPLAIWKSSELLMIRSFQLIPDSRTFIPQLVSCDLNSQEVKEFQVYGDFIRVLIYEESLVSIKRETGTPGGAQLTIAL